MRKKESNFDETVTFRFKARASESVRDLIDYSVEGPFEKFIFLLDSLKQYHGNIFSSFKQNTKDQVLGHDSDEL